MMEIFLSYPVDETMQVEETKLVIYASLVCDLCGRSCKSKRLLYKHWLTHQKLICQFCDKICTSKRELREYIITVHGERKKCNECDKTFSSKTNLRIHEKNKHEDGDNT